MTREKFPEKIPFRLTRMLTNAMEVYDYAGMWQTVWSVVKCAHGNTMCGHESFNLIGSSIHNIMKKVHFPGATDWHFLCLVSWRYLLNSTEQRHPCSYLFLVICSHRQILIKLVKYLSCSLRNDHKKCNSVFVVNFSHRPCWPGAAVLSIITVRLGHWLHSQFEFRTMMLVRFT